MEFRLRMSREEESAYCLGRKAANNHPLLNSSASSITPTTIITGAASKSNFAVDSSLQFDDAESGKRVFIDPLSEFISKSPPSVAKKSERLLDKTIIRGASDEAVETALKEWSIYKTLMMHKYTCANTITLSATSDFIAKSIKAGGKSSTTMHLEELDNPEKNAEEEVKIISQQEYVRRLCELNDEIAQAWQQNERVIALRLSIKVARLLSDTSVPQFYPTLFVLVTDIMDTLGSLVWKRIKMKAEFDDEGNLIRPLPQNFTCNDVPYEAKDTCNNWFYKIASIQELLPRIYLEMAILRCWHFLEENPLHVCQRLAMMIRGIADPLSSAFARLYLARAAKTLIPYETGFLITSLGDYTAIFQRVLSGNLSIKWIKSYSEKKMYARLVQPVIEWIVKCIFYHADQEKTIHLLRCFGIQKNDCNQIQNIHLLSVGVHYFLKQLPASVVSNYAMVLLKLVENAVDHSMAQYMNYRLLGFKLCECGPPREFCHAILSDVLEVITQYSDLKEHLMVMDVYVDFILQNSMENELGIVLDNIFDHVKRTGINDTELVSLESVILKLISHFTDITCILSLDHFVDILDVLYGSTRVSVYKNILIHISRNNQTVQDPVTRKILFDVCKVLHDSIDSLTSDDDCRQIAHLVTRFVQLVDFAGDSEKHLSFLIDCRATFGKMDPLKEALSHSSNYLASRTSKMVKEYHQRQVTDFVKACVSFNEVTIPSIRSILKRLHLFLETAEVALQNALLSHTEGLLKTAISCLQEIQNIDDLKDRELGEGIVAFIQKLSAFLIVLPGHPTQGAFYLLKGLLTLLDSQPWLIPGLTNIRAFSAIVSLTAALAQKELPYHVGNKEVISNDELYHGESSYNAELVAISNVLVQKIIDSLNQAPNSYARANQALDICNFLLISFKANSEVVESCTNLIKIAESSSQANTRYLQLTTEFLYRCTQFQK
ncbi:uncharacterized protein LOC131077967 isoform X1 [Cryptomeria japonica]|uniref:uncharacterized protein LOC131077967 isoform X1 n=2 Tax=Cryptomeria japonica TaxID=3369 RepID=UPI0025AC521C|nr:uncharacterized protein LOC131077967 isoform X1 [Cryptomeria japonica]